MFHPNTERLIDYWRGLKGDRLAPSRAEVGPEGFTNLAPQVFLLGRTGPGQYVFRLSGGFVASLHGRELRGEQALPLWAPADRPTLRSALELARRGGEPVVVTAEACAEGASVTLEVLFALVTSKDGEADRYLGLYQPVSSLAPLDDRPVGELSVRAVAGAVDDAPRLRLAAAYGRRIA